MKGKKKIPQCRKVPNSNRKIVEKRAQAQIHDMLTFLAWYRHFNKKWRG